jgi:GNAT superfamily N-acetyltransferase
VNITLAQPDDLAVVRACAEAAYEIYVERIGRRPLPMIQDFADPIAKQQLWLAKTGPLDDATSGPQVFIRGFALFYPRADHVHLENVAVFPSAQGLRVGSGLITFTEDQARASGYKAVELYTNIHMTENHSYYPHLGYQEINRGTEKGFERIYYRKEF